MVLYGMVPECHGSASGMVSECIMSAKMVSLNASGSVFLWQFYYQIIKSLVLSACRLLNYLNR